MTTSDVSKPLTKAQFVAKVAARSGLSKKDVGIFLQSLGDVLHQELFTSGQVTFHGLLKIKAVHKPAKEAHEGLDPFTKQPRTFAAKPASVRVKVTPLKALRDAVARS